MTPRKPILPTAQTGRRLLPIAVAALLTACAGLAPNTVPTAAGLETAAPSQWTAVAASSAQPATDVATWWNRFSDPQLTTLVTQAQQANNGVKAAQAALRQARAQADIQRAGLGPTLGTSGSAQRSQSGNNAASNRFQWGFDAAWEPDIFGGDRSAVNASDAEAQASAASLANVQVSLAAEVAVNYIALRGQQTRLSIAQNNLRTQQETLQITRWRAQAGLASSLDVEQALSAAEQTRAQLPALQASATQAMNALAVLTGQNPGALNATLAAPAAIPVAPSDLALAFPAETLRQRPDVQAAEARIEAAQARVAVAESARYPSFKLGGSLGLSALTLGTLTDGASLLKSLLASASIALYDGGARDAQVVAQASALEQAQANHRGTVLTALQEVEDALVALRGDQERLARLQASAAAAVNAELLARQRYQSGLIDFATLLTTQRSLLSAQDSVASAQTSLGTDHVKLYKALGGGWKPTAPATAQP